MSDFYPPYVPILNTKCPEALLQTLARIALPLAKQLAHMVAEGIRHKTGNVRIEKIIYNEKCRISNFYWNEKLKSSSPPKDDEPPDITPEKWASLGNFDFDLLAGPKKFTGTEGVNYAQHAVIGGKPHVQFTGTKLRTMVLTLGWHTTVMKDIEDSYKRLRDAMNTRQVMPLSIGSLKTGSYYDGEWVIESIPYTIEKFHTNGSIMKLELTLNLLEWNTGKPLEPGEHAPPKAIKPKNATPSQKTGTTTGKVDNNMVGMSGKERAEMQSR